jgi:hypothetical protein
MVRVEQTDALSADLCARTNKPALTVAIAILRYHRLLEDIRRKMNIEAAQNTLGE